VDATWLDAHLDDEWHIEGAVLWDVYRDLKDADYRLIGTAATMSPAARTGGS
jgi:thiosulfate/3-mercaptopyruvate sulfurtransferase